MRLARPNPAQISFPSTGRNAARFEAPFLLCEGPIASELREHGADAHEVVLDILVGEDLAALVLARRVADARGAAAHQGDRPVAVTRVKLRSDVASYELEPIKAGVEYRLTLRLRDDLPAGRVEDAVEIFTDDPDEERLVVPLYAIVRPARGRS